MEDQGWRRKLQSAQGACCLCLNTSKLTSMQDNFQFNMKTQTYSQIMNICLFIQVTESKIPDDCMICAVCVEHLKQLWIFFSQIKATQTALRGVIATATVKNEPIEMIHPEETFNYFIKNEMVLDDGTSSCGGGFERSVTPIHCEVQIKTESPEIKKELGSESSEPLQYQNVSPINPKETAENLTEMDAEEWPVINDTNFSREYVNPELNPILRNRPTKYDTISREKKNILIKCYEDGNSIGESAKIAGINENTAKGIINKYNKNGGELIEKSRGGNRNKKLTVELLNEIQKIVIENPLITLKSIRGMIHERKNLNLSDSTIHNGLNLLKIPLKRRRRCNQKFP